MKNKNQHKWLSEVTLCDICHKPMGKYFYNGKTIYGPWGLMCESCHKEVGCGLGIGLGQKYITKTRMGVDGFKERRRAD